MALYKRRNVWWFEFEYLGRRYRESAGTRSKTLASEIERKRHHEVEEAAHGIRRNRNSAVLFPVAAKEWLAVKSTTVNTITGAWRRLRGRGNHFGVERRH